MAGMTEIECACGCKQRRLVRTADVKRGWGLFYDKSCKGRGVDGFGNKQQVLGRRAEHKAAIKEKQNHNWCAFCTGNIRSGEGVRHEGRLYHEYCVDKEHGLFGGDDDDPSWDAHKDSF